MYYQIPMYLIGGVFFYLGWSMTVDYMIISYHRYRMDSIDY